MKPTYDKTPANAFYKWADTKNVTNSHWNTFNAPEFKILEKNVTKDEETTKVKYLAIEWTSNENCTKNSSSKFSVKLIANCDKENKTKAWADGLKESSDCSSTFEYYGPKACPTRTIVYKVLSAIAKIIASVLIIFGLPLTFAGSKFVFFFLGVTVTIFSTLILFILSFLIFLSG